MIQSSIQTKMVGATRSPVRENLFVCSNLSISPLQTRKEHIKVQDVYCRVYIYIYIFVIHQDIFKYIHLKVEESTKNVY